MHLPKARVFSVTVIRTCSITCMLSNTWNSFSVSNPASMKFDTFGKRRRIFFEISRLNSFCKRRDVPGTTWWTNQASAVAKLMYLAIVWRLFWLVSSFAWMTVHNMLSRSSGHARHSNCRHHLQNDKGSPQLPRTEPNKCGRNMQFLLQTWKRRWRHRSRVETWVEWA